MVAVVLAATAQMSGAQTFKTRVEGVTVDVSVTNGGRVVSGLGAADFEVTDNGVRQRIIGVHHEILPLDVTLVVDMSGGGVLQTAVLAGVERVRQSLRDDDRLRVLTFDAQVREHGAFASPRAMPPLEPSMARLDAFAASHETVLFDAIAAALESRREPDRRSLTMVFSAGRDTRSQLASAQVLERARRADTTVFVVHAFLNYAPTEAPPPGAEARPVPVVPQSVPARFYRDLAGITGGTVQNVEPLTVLRNDSERRSMRVRIGDPGLSEAFLRAIQDFRSSYVLRYTPEGVAPAAWHAIKVKVLKRGRHTVRARKGYAGR